MRHRDTRRPARPRATTRLAAAGAVACLVGMGAALGATGNAAATEGATEGTTDGGLTFSVGLRGEVDSFNPFNGIVAASYEMWALMYDYMITYSDKDMSPEPGLAESWETSEDGLTWTFDIRTGVKWSDGEDLTAEDIAFTYNRILDGGPEAVTWRSYLSSVDTVTAPDAETVVLELKSPTAVLPLLPMPIVPEHIWVDIPEDAIKGYPNEPVDGEPPVGSGPFRLVEGAAGGPQYRFEVNPDYWQGRASFDTLNYRVFRAEDTLVQALMVGEVDFAEDITSLQVDNLADEEGITSLLGDSPGFDEVAFNVGSIDTKTGEPLGDPNPAVLNRDFRFALNFAVNREEIIEKAYQGAGDPATTIIPPAYSQFQWVSDDPDAFIFDPEKAKDLLDAAGFTVGDDGFRTMPDGTPIGKLRLHARSDSETSLSVMTFMVEYLADVQIDSEVVAVDDNRLTNIILEGNYDMFEWGWYVEPDPDGMLAYLTCSQLGGWNDAWFCNDEYDALYEAQHAELDAEVRQTTVKQMQEILYNEAPYIVTVYSQIGEAYRSDRWEGFVPQPNPGGIMLFQYGIANYLNITPVTEAGGSTSSEGISSEQVIAIGVAGVLLFISGGALGGWAGYRKATVDYRE